MQQTIESAMFPVGTAVDAYEEHIFTGEQGRPTGMPVDSSVVAADGSLKFTGLDPDERYYAVAQVAGRWVWVLFSTDESMTARFGNEDPEDVPFQIYSPADQLADLFQCFVGGVQNFRIDKDGVLHLTGVSAPNPLALQADLDALEARMDISEDRRKFNVRDYGARDSTHGGESRPLSAFYPNLAAAQAVYPHATSLTQELDWAAIQAALNDACYYDGDVIFPYTKGGYVINETLTIKPAVGHGNQVSVQLLGEDGKFYVLNWTGANNKSVIRSLGWKRGGAHHVSIRINGKDSVVGFDIDGDATFASTGQLHFTYASVTGDGVSTNCVGYRMQHSGGADASVFFWDTCTVAFGGGAGNLGWVWEHQNCLGYTWVNCGGNSLAKCFTSVSTPGSGLGQNGGDGMTWIGTVSTDNAVEYEFGNAGVYTILGGRWELGKRFINIPGLGNANQSVISLVGCNLADFTPVDNIVFNIDAAIHLALIGCLFPRGGGAHTAAFITGGAHAAPSDCASVTMIGCATTTNSDVLWTLNPATTPVTCLNCTRINNGGQATARMSNRVPVHYTTYTPVTAASAGNDTVFKDSADGKLKFKDAGGVVNALY